MYIRIYRWIDRQKIYPVARVRCVAGTTLVITKHGRSVFTYIHPYLELSIYRSIVHMYAYIYPSVYLSIYR